MNRRQFLQRLFAVFAALPFTGWLRRNSAGTAKAESPPVGTVTDVWINNGDGLHINCRCNFEFQNSDGYYEGALASLATSERLRYLVDGEYKD